MLKLKKIAVTGGIASGKTTVCKIFQELGAYSVNADQIVHRLLSPDTDLGKDVIRLLGSDIVQEGKLNREAIAKKVFGNVALLKKLEKRVHPEVQKEIEAQYQNLSPTEYPLFVAEVPLLFESGQDKFYDAIVLVVTDEEESKRRFRALGRNDHEFENRSQNLLSMEEKIGRSTHVIKNNGSLDVLRHSVQTIFNSLKDSL